MTTTGFPEEPGALTGHARICSVCGVDWAPLPWVVLSRRGAVKGAGAGADRPLRWDLRARGSVWSTARINSTESPAGKPGRLESVCGTAGPQQRPNPN